MTRKSLFFKKNLMYSFNFLSLFFLYILDGRWYYLPYHILYD